MTNTEIENKIESILAQLTDEEKVAMCHCNTKFTSAGAARFEIDDLTMSDGPHGVRCEMEEHRWVPIYIEANNGTYLPPLSGVAATFNRELARRFGVTLGEEARHRNKDIMLGPGLNIMRTPLCGRNFEYLSEDPCVVENLAPELIQGLQSTDTAACVKHFALNNQELDRGRVNVEVSDKALHEIYLKGFKAAVQKGKAYSFMGAYNRYLGKHCCHNNVLVNDILKGEFGFDGAYISDWGGTHNTEEAVFGGLDIEMGFNGPYNECYLGDNFLQLVKTDENAKAALDDKVRRILRLMFRIKKGEKDRNKGSFNTPEHHNTAYEIASEAMVLLKNRKNVLPKTDAANILVVGINADKKHSLGGGSSEVVASYEITPLEGIKNKYKDSNITYVKTFNSEYETIMLGMFGVIDYDTGNRAYKNHIFSEENFGGEESVKYSVEPTVSENCKSMYCEATFFLQNDETFNLKFKGGKGQSLYIDNKLFFTLESDEEKEFKLEIKHNIPVPIRIEVPNYCGIVPTLTMRDECSHSREEVLNLAEKADLVIYCGGLNHNYDCECFDRWDISLPTTQNDEISDLLAVNPNTVVCITAGGPVEMPWIDNANAVIFTWYGGMEGGNALADIIKGNVNPSGKLPITFPKKLSDHPAEKYGEHTVKNVKYNEGIFVGYRGFDKDGTEPLFPFGYGLSYTEFAYSEVSATVSEDGVKVEFNVKNIGNVFGKETAQVYVGKKHVGPEDAIRQLRGFEKVALNSCEEKHVTINLTKDDFTDYSETDKCFKLFANDFIIYLASSSRNIVSECEVTIK